MCVKFGIASRRPSASASQGRSGQGNATDRCGLWTRATLNPRKLFLVLGAKEVHITIGGGEIGVCPLSFPYHAT